MPGFEENCIVREAENNMPQGWYKLEPDERLKEGDLVWNAHEKLFIVPDRIIFPLRKKYGGEYHLANVYFCVIRKREQ